MQFASFSISALGDGSDNEELNRFLRSHRVVQVERHLHCGDGRDPRWLLLVEWVDGDPKPEGTSHRNTRDSRDPTEGMTVAQAERYEQLRKVRSEEAHARGVQAYNIFNNDELVKIAALPQITAESIKSLKGISPSRLRAGIEPFIEFDARRVSQSQIAKINDETGGETDATDLPF